MSSWTVDLFEDMERMRREIDRILSDGRPSGWSFPFSRISFLPGYAARGYPLLNIGEDQNSVYVDALAPGVDPDTLNVSVMGRQLVISGEKLPLPKKITPEAVHRSERSAGTFSRSVALSSEIETQKVKAQYNNGLLKITLPKAEAAKPKQIQVNLG
jgi:HSP20 family protein